MFLLSSCIFVEEELVLLEAGSLFHPLSNSCLESPCLLVEILYADLHGCTAVELVLLDSHHYFLRVIPFCFDSERRWCYASIVHESSCRREARFVWLQHSLVCHWLSRSLCSSLGLAHSCFLNKRRLHQLVFIFKNPFVKIFTKSWSCDRHLTLAD